jgi:hypothetical protein
MRPLALATVLVLVLAACGGGSGDEAAQTRSAPEPVAGVSLGGETLDGESLSLADLRGKPVFVNVWASW